MGRLREVEALVELDPFVVALAVESDAGHADPELALVAADRPGVGHLDEDLLELAGEQDLRARRAEVLVGVERVDERPQPARRDRRIVVDEGDEVELAGRSDPEVAPAGEPRVGERLDDTHRRELDRDAFDDVVERPVVDHHDVEPVRRIVGRQQRLEAVDRHLTAVVVDHDDAHERVRRFHQVASAAPAGSAAAAGPAPRSATATSRSTCSTITASWRSTSSVTPTIVSASVRNRSA